MIKKLGPCPTCKTQLEEISCDYCDAVCDRYKMVTLLLEEETGDKTFTFCGDRCLEHSRAARYRRVD